MKRILVAAVLLTAACRSSTPEPIDISAEDMCAFCRMAISERRFAAEYITSDGDAIKFDEIGCMLNYVGDKRGSAPAAAYFVMDYEERRWIRAEQAWFARSVEFKTPMEGGIAAFGEKSRAEQAAARFHGTVRSFKEILGGNN